MVRRAGRKSPHERTGNEATDGECRHPTTPQVRILHHPQTPRDVKSQIPASRQELLEHGEARPTGAFARAKPIRNGIERDRQADGVERDGIQPVSTARRDKVISESVWVTC